jgi:hypothetical protein
MPTLIESRYLANGIRLTFDDNADATVHLYILHDVHMLCIFKQGSLDGIDGLLLKPANNEPRQHPRVGFFLHRFPTFDHRIAKCSYKIMISDAYKVSRNPDRWRSSLHYQFGMIYMTRCSRSQNAPFM